MSKGTPLISVIIPTYNRRDYLTDAIDSVLSQQTGNIEIIVVDDGSTDGTADALRPYSGSIKYVYQENRGGSSARNRGVNVASGELLAFLDSDDLWLPGKLKAQSGLDFSENLLSFHGVEWFVGCKQDLPLLKRSENVKWPRCRPDGFVNDPVLDVAQGRYFTLVTLLCSKSVFQKVGFFDEDLTYGEDEDWFSRASSIMKFHYIPETFVKIRYHSNQMQSESEKTLRSLIKVFERMRARTRGVHPQAYAEANRRLAAKWSHLANRLACQGRSAEASRAALAAFLLQPICLQRLMKAGLMLTGLGRK
jgi:glycosyltransferase involved in cell wall biosynthesis